jgi:hypothetical protein
VLREGIGSEEAAYFQSPALPVLRFIVPAAVAAQGHSIAPRLSITTPDDQQQRESRSRSRMAEAMAVDGVPAQPNAGHTLYVNNLYEKLSQDGASPDRVPRAAWPHALRPSPASSRPLPAALQT